MNDRLKSGPATDSSGSELSWLVRHDRQPVERKLGRVTIVLLAMCLSVALLVLAGWQYLSQDPAQEPLGRSEAMKAMLDAPFAPSSLRQLSPREARDWNSQTPSSVSQIAPAAAFVALGRNPGDSLRSLDCLTSAIYYEAGRESVEGQRAVAQVILNRVRHPAFPATVCGVVFQGSERKTGCQFTFTCDGALSRKPTPGGWLQARLVAEQALAGSVFLPAGWATHYHADYVVPYWASSLAKIGQVGAHIFYTWKGAGGTAPSFWQRYAGNEPAAGLSFAVEPAAEAAIAAPQARRPELVLVSDKERPVIDSSGREARMKPDLGPTAKAEEVPSNERWVIQSPVLP